MSMGLFLKIFFIEIPAENSFAQGFTLYQLKSAKTAILGLCIPCKENDCTIVLPLL
jgi:hypothetical protein